MKIGSILGFMVILLLLNCGGKGNDCDAPSNKVLWKNQFDEVLEAAKKDYGTAAVLLTFDKALCEPCANLVEKIITSDKEIVKMINCHYHPAQLEISMHESAIGSNRLKVNDEFNITLHGKELNNPVQTLATLFNLDIYQPGKVNFKPFLILMKPTDKRQIQEKIDLSARTQGEVRNILLKYR